MALSDDLTKLATRAQDAEAHAAAAQSKAKADLEADVANARASAQAEADRLHESADANRDRISAGGTTCSAHGAARGGGEGGHDRPPGRA